jgi:hypothetical protein
MSLIHLGSSALGPIVIFATHESDDRQVRGRYVGGRSEQNVSFQGLAIRGRYVDKRSEQNVTSQSRRYMDKQSEQNVASQNHRYVDKRPEQNVTSQGRAIAQTRPGKKNRQKVRLCPPKMKTTSGVHIILASLSDANRIPRIRFPITAQLSRSRQGPHVLVVCRNSQHTGANSGSRALGLAGEIYAQALEHLALVEPIYCKFIHFIGPTAFFPFNTDMLTTIPPPRRLDRHHGPKNATKEIHQWLREAIPQSLPTIISVGIDGFTCNSEAMGEFIETVSNISLKESNTN